MEKHVEEWGWRMAPLPFLLSSTPWMTSSKPITSTTTFELRTPRSLSPDQIFSWVSDPFWFAFWVLPQALQTQYDSKSKSTLSPASPAACLVWAIFLSCLDSHSGKISYTGSPVSPWLPFCPFTAQWPMKTQVRAGPSLPRAPQQLPSLLE